MPLDAGITTLTTVQDMFGKLGRDMAELRRSPTDVDVCFNFFLTAEHLPDWHFAADAARASAFRKEHSLLRVCSQIASGAKRFRVSEKRHQAVAAAGATTMGVPAFAPVGRVSARASANLAEFVLDLEAEEAADLGATISVRELAERVVQFWREQLAG